jgi:hypothetical protein
METFYYLYSAMDSVLMYFYRYPDNPLLGYFLGTFVLTIACTVIGEYSISIAFMLNKKQIYHDNREITHYQNLSFEALKIGDKASFKACNSIANEAYGNNFFTQVALSAASLWPVFIGLGWLQYRFSGVNFSLPFSFPGAGDNIGYLATFLFCYMSARILSRMIKKRLSNLKAIDTLADN